MPRRNQRADHPPIDLTPADLGIKPHSRPRPFNSPPPSATDERHERAERQRKARIQNGIDWSTCVIPGCGASLLSYGRQSAGLEARDPDHYLPLCHRHASVVWRNVQSWYGHPQIMEIVTELDTKAQARQDASEAAFTARDQGGESVIYFIRHNGLVKAGWTKDLFARLKAYGPGTEVLCHYPGTRADETHLHRQLRPALAKGREWYHDGDLVALFVQNALERYGPPTITSAGWTEPKSPVIKQRRRR